MRERNKCGQKMVCIDGICFLNTYDAGKFLMLLAERRQRVHITHRRDWGSCLVHDRPK